MHIFTLRMSKPIQSLIVKCSKITDVGIQSLACLTNLTSVDLVSCFQITDRGIQALGMMSNLKSIYLGGLTQLTSTGPKDLYQSSKLWYVRGDHCQ